MPSGAKKRKAARKRKEKENKTNPSTNNPQGNGGLKSIGEDGSDGGEGNFPAYNGHDDQHNPFKDGSEELQSAAQPHASDVESLKVVFSDVKIDQVFGGKEDCVVLVEGSLKSEESSESKSISFEHHETAKESYFENENENGSYTSQGESLSEKNSNNGNFISVEEAVVCHVSVKSNDSVSKIENSDSGNVVLDKPVVHPEEVNNLAMKLNEDNVYSLTNENERTLSMEEPKLKECDSNTLTPVSASAFTKFTNGAKHIKDCDLAERSKNQPHSALAPNVVQKTSWLSCCGLFEVLSSSHR
ncbi:hypothetical protein LR48_Vigan01g038300 [Vigna angularis]|uniref:Uncharacterized protein n=2 Tax=Phaseolus angularis TaxID=3914 RepID=A0A0L9TJN1_PHAAN|nr:uncharacterized protein LOC108335171 [Vigna angularis]KAG2410331.1 uncharacterized protein HKW66_Vig0009960 [Vigna angularis]KOM30828.1 hypothetical protein LR48_Vigan01g038300 [Vigna angularis]BAT73564.1 hypothetical protein VIGAN_01106300 [Vigna angularis var. angularis]